MPQKVVQDVSPANWRDIASSLRRDIVDALHACGGGHYGGSLSVLEILIALYYGGVLRVDPVRPADPARDRLILSQGHAALALYAVLARRGFFDTPLRRYAQCGSPLQGHPDMRRLPGVDFSTGSLGKGLGVGLGMALALRGIPADVWVVLGDGECQEGAVWEAAMAATRLGVASLRAVVDCNGFQECAAIAPAEEVGMVARRWRALGWHTIVVDGHDVNALVRGCRRLREMPGRPGIILARTVKGRGFPLVEADPLRFHCTTVTLSEQAVLTEVGR
jgi:transketolase